ncbi:MAG TPA: YihY/virulence factor BrkB family protein [Bryobacteraceae bacterium]|nr:YihY/virulence factor BrkB family protein [Bryobacteraceae bacterium]
MDYKAARTLVTQTVSSWSSINAPRLGASLAFYTMLSMAPLLVFSIGIAGLIFGRDAAQGRIVAQVGSLVGPQGAGVLQSLLLSSTNKSSGIVWAIVGVFMLLLGASGVFGELRDSLNLVWGAKTQDGGFRGMLRYRFFSFAMVVGIGFLLIVSLLVSAAIAAVGKFFEQFLPAPEAVLHVGSLILTFAAVTVLFALLYKVVPDVHIEWRDVWIGAAVTSLLFSIGKFLIGLYIGKASVGSAYGAAGSLVVFLVWVYYSAQIFFLGAQFTHIFAERHGSRAEARAERKREAHQKTEAEKSPQAKLAS